ncbi:type III-B CRISPR module-associated protein Cmr3 [Archangium lipolyticum]|uniref:type III-B CRISPR module-associated protein Cmr3 n=1 Tax=Archangium lipolyticum TaxID=2970465 RepID=UPI002149A5AC|nr:type III-B CRISPR module-associated protein Cmr3 [Archangium lipolyticum]
MSINYVLYMAESWSPREALREVTHRVQLPEEAPRSGKQVEETTAIPHLWVVATQPKPPVDDYVREDHGFLPKLRLHIRLDKSNLHEAEDHLLDLVSQILLRSTSDVVLLREEDSVVLLRREGRLEIHADALWSSPERRARLEKLLRERV